MTPYEQGFLTKCAEYGVGSELAQAMCKYALFGVGAGRAGRAQARILDQTGREALQATNPELLKVRDAYDSGKAGTGLGRAWHRTMDNRFGRMLGIRSSEDYLMDKELARADKINAFAAKRDKLRAAYGINPQSQSQAQPQAQPPAQPAAQPQAQPPAQPAAQPPSQPAAQPPAQPAAQPPSQPAAQPSARPAAKPRPRTKPVSAETAGSGFSAGIKPGFLSGGRSLEDNGALTAGYAPYGYRPNPRTDWSQVGEPVKKFQTVPSWRRNMAQNPTQVGR